MSDIFHKSFKADLSLSEEDIKFIAAKLHFRFDEGQSQNFMTKMNEMLDLIDVLNEVEIDENTDFKFINHIHDSLGLQVATRADQVDKIPEEVDIFSNTEQRNGFFVAPKVL